MHILLSSPIKHDEKIVKNAELILMNSGIYHWKYLASKISFSKFDFDTLDRTIYIKDVCNLTNISEKKNQIFDVIIIKPLQKPPNNWKYCFNSQICKPDSHVCTSQNYTTMLQKESTHSIESIHPQKSDLKTKDKKLFKTIDRTSYGLISFENQNISKILQDKQNMRIMSMELFAKSRCNLLPDPKIDEIQAFFYAIYFDELMSVHSGCFIVETSSDITKFSSSKYFNNKKVEILSVASEQELFNNVVTLVSNLDPDFLIGYEVQLSSWGYFLSRAAVLGYDLCHYLSRIPCDKQNSWCSSEKDLFGADNGSEIHIVGRIVLNVWRLMRAEENLRNYNFETVSFHALHKRYPYYSNQTLTRWFNHKNTSNQYFTFNKNRVIEYFITRANGNLELFFHYNLLDRTSELARLFGILFYEVLTRGSQYRVRKVFATRIRTVKFNLFLKMLILEYQIL